MSEPSAANGYADPEPSTFNIAYCETGYNHPFDVELIVRCVCGTAYAWHRTIPGSAVLAFARDHADCVVAAS